MRTVTAKELKDLDPRRFEKEYWKWREYAHEYDWYDCVEQKFTDKMAANGVRVDRIYFAVAYGQSDYACFDGRIDVGKWMQCNKLMDVPYSEAYPALFLAVEQDGSNGAVTSRRSGRIDLEYNSYATNTDPCGVFQHLDQSAWEELIEEQENSAGLESELYEWCNAMCHELYRELRDEYEYISSEESFIESCECNDVTFEMESEDEIYS